MAVVSDPEPACRPDNSGACLRLHLAHIYGRGNALDQEKRNEKSAALATATIAARGKRPRCIRRAMHPVKDRAGPFLSGVEYGQYAPSSRLVLAVRGIVTTASRCDAGFHHGLLEAEPRPAG